MKSIQISKDLKVSIEENEVPKKEKGQVLLKLLYGGICGSDLNTYRGKSPYTKYPVIPGHELSAEILEVDNNDRGLKKGMFVTVNPYFNCEHCYSCERGFVNCCTTNETMGVQRNGGFSQYITMPIERVYDANGLSPKLISIVEPFCIGYHGVKRANIQSGEKVLVVGAGTIGIFAALSAKLMGADVFVCDVAKEKLDYAAKNFDIDGIILNDNNDTFNEKVSEITNGNGFDVTVEAVGLPSTFQNCVDAVAFHGRTIVIGVGKSNLDFNFTLIQKKEMDIMGSRNAVKSDFLEVIDIIKNNKVRNLERVITNEYSYLDAAKAFDEFDKNGAHMLKAILKF